MTQIARLIETAVGELGYTESSTSTGRWNKYANDFDTKPGWTEWFNTKKNGADWCTIFHDWCYVKTFGFNKAVQMLFNQDPYSSLRAGCAYLERLYSRNGRWGSTPKVGAQVVFGVDHTGIVIAIRAGYVYTIEGNWTSSVKARKHDINSTDISGYGYPLFDSDEHGTWHMVESSDTLNGIAARYNVPVEWIIKQNHISNPNNIQTGDVFYIPNTEVTEPEEPEDPDVITYIVQEGDTLNDIAARYGTTAQAIADYNGISDVNLIYVGQVLYIPTGSSQSYTTYIVKSGDSLGRIAVSYGLTVAEVAAYNSISDPDTIYVGQEIKIPVSGRRDYIRMFQQAVCDAGVAQITVDGIWGSETASVAVYAEVEKGTVGPLATFAQTMLVAYGYSLPNSGIDGDFWTESVNATIQYQQDHGLVADGIIGIATWKDMLQVN